MFPTNNYFKMDGIEQLQLLSGEGGILEIDLPKMDFSKFYDYKGPRLLRFGKMGKDANSQPLFEVLATVKVPSSIREAILVFVPIPKDSRKEPVLNTIQTRKGPLRIRIKISYRVFVIDASPSRFTGGSSIYFNFSRHNIIGRLGKRKLELKPGSKQIVQSRPWKALLR